MSKPLSIASLPLIVLVAPAGAQAPVLPPIAQVEVVARYPHDRTAFTEGLIWHDGALYESVGREGESDVRRVRLANGKVERRATIPATQFGEGLALAGSELVSLTWHGGVAHRWNAKTLKKTGQSHFASEGWGLTGDGRSLIQSDGSANLYFLDPRTLKEKRRITVKLKGQPLDQINELEWVDGAILANVWHQPWIVRIDPASGTVTRLIDLRPIVAEIGARDPEAVANGIAYDAKSRRLFVTGKLWPTLFEIRLKDR
ncbi:glutamine cyclotransferase [Sphingomonas metalli]|uniref:Glutamine cyclotransferase n=1 Tax=Sphingomonas metalli TaxID=1779358 RepID=A0A916WS35_9SPHN|nr:glutaminyl-peptide cyclotransferase [Sphingomonas metalli]GGB24426.1 glutamine cyclotransferase [Sphingomonas metalli]